VFQKLCSSLVTDNALTACKLGVKKIIVASSETTYGVCFAQGDADYHSFPLEEDYDVDPEDSYALSKICAEKTARTVSLDYVSAEI
jgi:nucleoside-diphosphate-sugar epimerase